ncbi:MAG: threonine/serine dehydratase [Chloroflexi bacterium]|nr:MAG: threonine/serine dehydratase [Chloroflexota bacterium]TMD66110.1 MAG: threonine/serine dehydratase [Chloroflexota bacterium]
MKITGLRIEDVRRAQPAIADAAIRTPLVPLNLWDAPAEIFLKLENLQPIGSFKIRGAANAMKLMSKDELARGVLVASAGNMAQGAAWNARRLHIPCTVIAPDYAPDTKVQAIERLGGRVIKVPFDRWWQTFTDRSYPGVNAAFIHSFDDDRVMAGNGTIGLELLEDLPNVDSVLIPWGGGGLACGIATALRAIKPSVRIYAVEADTGAPLTASLQAGSPQVVDYQPSFVDGIGSKTVFNSMLVMAQELLDGSLTASLDEIAAALRLMAERNRVIAEGAGAVALAVALSGKAGGGRIACIVSGGNIDLPKLAKILGER